MSHQQSFPRTQTTLYRTHDDKRGPNGWSAWPTGGISLSDPRAASMYGGHPWSSGEKHSLPDYHSSRSGLSLAALKRRFWRLWPFPSPFSSSSFVHRHSRSTSSARKLSLASTPLASTARFILLCSLWYTTSALSSNTGKAIMIQFRYPITLTIVQFGFVALFSLLFMSPLIPFTTMRMPTRAIVAKTLPMGMFQVGGHMFSSMAISRIPVSTVHTIKALSPLFTVAAYALLYGVSYSAKTYISLFPLTVGVMLACSFDMSASNTTGLLCAFGSALVFVSSNIFFKKIMPAESGGSAASGARKLDKLNLLFYCSVTAFILMLPIWLVYDMPPLLATQSNPEHITHPNHGHSTPHSVTYYFFMNGTVHFAQNLIAFVILASTSPVTYSIASLIKRVVVICIAIAWFNQTVHPVQALGIAMTFGGLYMYNSAKSDVQRGETQMRRVEAARAVVLPSHRADMPVKTTRGGTAETTGMASLSTAAYGRPRGVSSAARYAPPPPPPISSISSMQTQSQLLSPPPPRHQGVHPPATPNLTIQTTPQTGKELRHMISPVDSYPSPPPSLDDSPPSDTVPLPPLDYEYEHDAGHEQRTPFGHRPEGPAFSSFSFPTATVSA